MILYQEKESGFCMQFEELELVDALLRAVSAEGYETATPIQAQVRVQCEFMRTLAALNVALRDARRYQR